MGRRHFRDEEPQKLSNMLESPQLGRAEALPPKPMFPLAHSQGHSVGLKRPTQQNCNHCP